MGKGQFYINQKDIDAVIIGEGEFTLYEYLTIPDKTITVQEESQTIDVVKKVQPSVVSIVVSKDLQKLYQYNSSPFQNDPFFRDFFEGFNVFNRCEDFRRRHRGAWPNAGIRDAV